MSAASSSAHAPSGAAVPINPVGQEGAPALAQPEGAPALVGADSTLADYLGVSVECPVSFENACAIAKGLKGCTKPLPVPVALEGPVGPCNYKSLPIEPVLSTELDKDKPFKNVFDLNEKL